MTYAQMEDYFNILQDKFGSPYHTPDEIALFLNRGQIDYVMSFLPPVDDTTNIELNAITIARLYPLIFKTGTPAMNIGGEVEKSAVETALGRGIIRLLAVSVNTYPAKATRWNNWYTYIKNAFKAPTLTSP